MVAMREGVECVVVMLLCNEVVLLALQTHHFLLFAFCLLACPAIMLTFK